MKKHLGISLLLLTFVNTCYADFKMRILSANSCKNIAGEWTGIGKAYHWMIGTCIYNGKSKITPLDDNGKIQFDVVADKESGSILCTQHEVKQMFGSCKNGILIINTNYGDLSGNVYETNADAKGSLNVLPGIYADVEILIHR